MISLGHAGFRPKSQMTSTSLSLVVATLMVCSAHVLASALRDRGSITLNSCTVHVLTASSACVQFFRPTAGIPHFKAHLALLTSTRKVALTARWSVIWHQSWKLRSHRRRVTENTPTGAADWAPSPAPSSVALVPLLALLLLLLLVGDWPSSGAIGVRSL